MKEIHDSKCPLCNAAATFEFRDADNIRLFQCGNCTDFFISRLASTALEKAPHRKANFAEMAASLQGKENILAITWVVGELRAEEVPRTSYPL